MIDLARVAADMLAMPWEKVEVVWGNTGKHLPWTVPVGRQPDDARDDARESCRRDGRQAQAAGDRRDGSRRLRPTTTSSAASACSGAAVPGRGLSYAQAAQRAIALGGKFDGHELPEDINAHDEGVGGGAGRARADGRGQGHVPARRRHLFVRRRLRRGRGGRRDRQGRRSSTFSAVGDVGTVVNPRSLHGQIERRHLPGHRPRALPEAGLSTRSTALPLAGGSTTPSR